MKQTNERLCALAQKADAAALDSLIENNKSFIGKAANDLFRSMNLAQSGLNLDTDDLKQAGNLGLWKAVPKFDAARGMKFLTYAAPAIRNAMMRRNLNEQKTFYMFTRQKKQRKATLSVVQLSSRGSSPYLIMSIQCTKP